MVLTLLLAAGARVVANHSGLKGLLVVEPIPAAAAAAAGPMAGARAAVAALPTTALEAAFSANAAAAVGVSALLSSQPSVQHTSLDNQGLGALGASATNSQGLGGSSNGLRPHDPGFKPVGGLAGWLAGKLGVVDEVNAAAAAAAVTGAAAAGSSSGAVAAWRLVLLAERSPQQLVQVSSVLCSEGSLQERRLRGPGGGGGWGVG
jgi:hypothetical protein